MNEDSFHLGIKALVRNADGKFLLLKVNPAELRGFSGEPYWDIPGGRIQRGSFVEATLRREVEEETGLTVTSSNHFATALSRIRIPLKEGNDVGLILSAYVCQVSDPSSIRLSNEHTESGWFSPKEASEKLKVKYPVEFTDRIATLNQN